MFKGINKLNLIFISVLFQSFSFLIIKYASIYKSYVILLFFISFLFMLIRAYIWQIVLKHNELSRVYPFNSFVQILIFIYSVVLFGEIVSFFHILGLGLMVSGIVLLGKK